jgi:PAS domain S-box-containing protein
MTALAATGPRRRFAGALATAVTLALGFTVVLAGPFPAATREAVSAVGFVTGAVAIMVSGGLAARRCVGRRRRSWLIVVSASGVAVAGNVVTTLAGGDPVQDTSVAGDLLVGLALVLTVFALLGLSDTPARRARLLVSSLDGIVVGCTVLIIAIVLVFSRLVEAENIAERPVVLVFPILDVAVLATALLVLIRSQGDRSFFAMISFGFILYAVADLAFAVQNAQGTYTAGTPQDLMWITAYLVLAASAWHPAASRSTTPAIRSSVDVQSTLLIFGLLLGAAVVQTFFPGGPLTETLTGLWVILVLAVGVRQVLLVSDNQNLRAGLEQRVQEKTADLRRVTRRIEVMLNSVGDGIYGVDLAGRITFTNPSTLSILGYDASGLMGLSAHEVLHAETEGAAPEGGLHDWASCYIAEAIGRRQVVAGRDDTYRRRDGTVLPVEVTASPLLDEDDVLGAVVVFRDVTERREIDRMKDEFLSIVSHELRTPLTAIRGSLDMLSDGGVSPLPDPAQRMVTIATRSSERLTRLINDILDVERIRSGKLRMDCAPVEARDLLESTLREMGPLAAASGLDLSVKTAQGQVFADSDRIVQTMTNLVGNAIKFSPAGTAITLTAQERDEDVVITVSDEGRGIPADKIVSVFNPFEQVDSSDSRDQGGTGLGLAICRGIVERHGGRIWAESELGTGTSVHFTLPQSAPGK